MTREQRRALRLHQWAMRCADKINRAVPERASHLGNLSDFAGEFGHTFRTWEAAYSHVLATMRSEGIE